MWPALALFILLGTFIFSAKVYAEEEDDKGREKSKTEETFDVTAEASGNDYDETYTVTIEVENMGKDFGGHVRLKLMSRTYKTAAYDTYVAIAGGEKQTVTLTIPAAGDFDYANAEATVEITDEKGKTIFSEKQRKLFDERENHYAVISDDAKALSYLDTSRNYWYDAYEGISETTITEDDLKDENGLDDVSFIFLDNYDSGEFSREEIENIQKWVRSGGVLIIGTGKNLDDAFWAFDDDFIDADLQNGVVTQEYINYSYAMTDVSHIKYGSEYDSGNYYLDNSGIKRTGAGAVVLLEFGLAGDNMDTYSFPAALGSLLRYYNFMDNNSYSTYTVYNHDIETCFKLLQGDGNFSQVFLKILMVVYILLIGPGLYFILKKLKIREKIWLFIPLTTLFFVLLVFLVTVGNGPAKKSYATLRVAQASGQSYEADYIMGYQAAGDEWSVNIAKNAIGAGPMMAVYDYASGREQYDYLTSLTPEGMKLTYKPDGVFDPAYFKVCRKNKGYGPLKFSLKSSGGRISGTIQNKTGHDFKYYLIVCEGNALIYEGGKNGDKTEIDMRATSVNHSTLLYEAERAYDQGDYENAKYLAMLSLSLLQVHEGENCVIGICDAERLLDGKQKEDSFLCIYEKE
ncbi:MAG: hypothetical protein K6B44_06290 [Lachnospiraceae bacterium]|nr:hypothetical protein [Lachnospiraceae bacterium]